MPLDPTDVCGCYYTNFWECHNACQIEMEAFEAAIRNGVFDEAAAAQAEREEVELVLGLREEDIYDEIERERSYYGSF